MKRTCLCTYPFASAFAAGAVDEPATEGGEDIVPDTFLTLLGGA